MPIMVFLVSYFDLGTTLYLNETHNGFEEGNPIAAYVWDKLGGTGLIVFKLAATLPSCFCMGWVLHNKNRYWKIAVSVFGLAVCSLLVGWWIFWFFVK